MAKPLIPDFFEEAEQHQEHAYLIPITLALHKFESQNQDFAKPRIFVRECNEYGLTEQFMPNKIYRKTLGDKIKKMVNDLNNKSKPRILETLDWLAGEDNFRQVQIMLDIDDAEDQVYEALRSLHPKNKRHVEQINQMPHLFKRGYDEKGIPSSYSLNPAMAQVAEKDGRRYFEVHGIPITDEEMKQTDMDKLFKLLTNPSD